MTRDAGTFRPKAGPFGRRTTPPRDMTAPIADTAASPIGKGEEADDTARKASMIDVLLSKGASQQIAALAEASLETGRSAAWIDKAYDRAGRSVTGMAINEHLDPIAATGMLVAIGLMDKNDPLRGAAMIGASEAGRALGLDVCNKMLSRFPEAPHFADRDSRTTLEGAQSGTITDPRTIATAAEKGMRHAMETGADQNAIGALAWVAIGTTGVALAQMDTSIKARDTRRAVDTAR